METGLGWFGAAAGAVGFVLTFAISRLSGEVRAAVQADECRRARLEAGLTALLTLIFWWVAMRSGPPFSRGQTLAYGFLIGGISSALMCLAAYWLGVGSTAGPPLARHLAYYAPAFLALGSVSFTYAIFHAYPSHAVTGFAIGAVMGAIVRFCVEGLRSAREDLIVQAWALFAVAPAASIFLAVEHFDTSLQRSWWPMPIVMGLIVSISGIVGSEITAITKAGERPRASATQSALIASVLTIVLSLIYGWRQAQDWRIVEVTLVGIACAAASAWLIASMPREKRGAWGLDAASACVLLVLAFAVVEFRLWSGLGIGMGLIAAWAVALPALAARIEDEQSAVLRGISTVLFVWLSIVLYRVFIELYRPETGVEIRVHYTFIGALIGAILPFVFVSSIFRLKECTRGDLCALAGAASLGLFAAAAPVAVCLIWESRGVAGFIFGLIAASVFMLMSQLFQAGTPDERRGASLADFSPALLVTGSYLAAIQFTRLLGTFELTRATKIWALAVAVVIAVAWFVVTGMCSRRSTR